MEIYQREFLLSRIVAGYLRYPVNKKSIIIHSPSPTILYEASEFAYNTFLSAKQNGVMDDSDVYKMLLDYDLWSPQQEKELNEILPGHIEHWKVELYKAAFKTEERKKIRLYLDTAEKELARLHNIRHNFDHATCQGLSNFAKHQYIINKCTYLGQKKYNWKQSSSYLAMLYVQEHTIAETAIRELSHNNPWEYMWAAGKKNGSLFPKSAVELTSEQQRLIMWSSMYDSVRESGDCPHDDVLNDDDMLDGWLILKRKERESHLLKGQIEGSLTNEKISKADEIYMVVDNIEDAKKIDMMNSAGNRAIKKQRLDLINKKGEVNEAALPDVKQDLIIQLNRAAIQSGRG